MTIIGKHVEESMQLLAQQAKDLGFGMVTVWCHISTDDGYRDWSIFTRESPDSKEKEMFCGKTFEEALTQAREFINNRKNAEVLLSL